MEVCFFNPATEACYKKHTSTGITDCKNVVFFKDNCSGAVNYTSQQLRHNTIGEAMNINEFGIKKK